MAKSSSGNHRNSTTERFATASSAGRNKPGHQLEPRGKSGDGPGSPFRDTNSGQYVTPAYAKAHPKTTVREK